MGINGEKPDDGDGGLQIHSEMQYGFRNEYGGDRTDDFVVDV